MLDGEPFSFLVRIKEEEEIDWNNIGKRELWRNFADYFNAYAKMINLKYGRTGSLFQERYRRKKVYSEKYLRQLIHYIHLNPVKHGISDSFENYPYSSYAAIISGKQTRLEKDKVIQLFYDLDNFIYFHKKESDIELINEFIEDDWKIAIVTSQVTCEVTPRH